MIASLCLLTVSSRAGSVDAEVALDMLHATSQSEAASSGPQPNLSATELGLRARGEAVQGRSTFGLDYWGRQPFGGLFPNAQSHTFYQLDVALAASDAVTVGLGRFIAPSAVLLLVDGARLAWRPGAFGAEIFAGRREDVELAARAIPLGPAAGGGARGLLPARARGDRRERGDRR